MNRLLHNYNFLIVLALVFGLKTTFAQSYIAGNTYFDSTGFVEYRAGNLPIIISAPHGGIIEPDSIADLSCNGTPSDFIDAFTKQIAEGIYDVFVEKTGCYPHIIINLLHKKKFNANRDITRAACGNSTVEQSWQAYHGFIDSAKAQIVQDNGRGLLLDLHGHSHPIQRIELGYLLDTTELRLSDTVLNSTTYIDESSLRTLVATNIQNLSHSDLLRGQYSFGTLLENKGLSSIPSSTNPFTQTGERYFTGGYITQRHGSRDNNGEIDAIQLEFNQDIRFTSVPREMLIDSLSATSIEYINYHYDNQFTNNFCAVLPIELIDFDAQFYSKQQYVRLDWTTLTEENNDYFVIEKSLNEHEWIDIGRVNGQGNTSERNDYFLIDDKLTKGKTHYYRLKSIDFDGNISYSSIQSVGIYGDFNSKIEIYPNPIGTNEKISFTNRDKISRIELFSLTGMEIKIENLLDRELPNNLPSGVYLLKIELKSGDLEFKRLIIQ